MATNPFSSANDSEANFHSALTTPLPEADESTSFLGDVLAAPAGSAASGADAGAGAGAGVGGDDGLAPPDPQRFSSYLTSDMGADTPRDSVLSNMPSSVALAGAGAAVAGTGTGAAATSAGGTEEEVALNEKAAGDTGTGTAGRRRNRTRRKWLWLGAALAFVIVAAAVAIPVGIIFGLKHKSSSGSSGSSGSGGGSGGKNGATSGGNGSLVTTENGTTFTYTNPFGGIWVSDPANPFSDAAFPNSWTPPLNSSWTWGVDKVYGVNLGGWFVLEPFIAPALFQKYQNATAIALNNNLPIVIDEWTLSEAMIAAGDTQLSEIEDHYNTFITEDDFAQIAGAGLNWVRLPIPYWAIEKWDTSSDQEPFLARTCWTYILRAFRWARKYGLRVNLDLHTAPGSQNGFNHSGKEGQVNMMFGVMGYANAQRTLEYIRIIAEFIAQPEYQSLIPMYGVINEALISTIGKDVMTNFYVQAYDIVRDITGIGEGKGPFISIHDGFQSLTEWAGFLPGSDRINLDNHPYFAFDGQPNTEPIGAWPAMACNSWGPQINASQSAFGLTVAGEFSNSINDCGLYLNGVGGGHSYGGDCNFWMDSTQWNETIVDGLHEFMLASMDALQNWFFWTWKIGNASDTNSVQAPLWSYQLGLQGGWMPTDPRTAFGACASLGVIGTPFPGTYSAWQTGGPGAGTISPDVLSSFTAWPPTTISGVTGDMDLIYTYTSTVAVLTLPTDSFSGAPASATRSEGDGWADAQDTGAGVTEVAGCTYPSAWLANGSPVQTALCTGSATATATATPARFAREEARITPPPVV